jgi:hypothetical protein
MKELVTGKAASYDVWRWSRVAVWNRGVGLGWVGVWNESGPTHQMLDGVVRREVRTLRKKYQGSCSPASPKNPTKVRTSGIEAPQ